MSRLKHIHRQTIETYEANASAWDQQRPRVMFEKHWLDRFLANVPAGGRVLDVGCGAGEPIAQYILAAGYELTGIDASPAMIEISSTRFPGAIWHVMDMRRLSLPETFDGIVAWDSFFHLDPDEQREMLRLFCNHLNPRGCMLLTIGDEAGEVLGSVNGEQVYHSSLHPDEYESILEAAGFADVSIVLCDPSCGEHSVLLATGYSA